MQQRFWQAPLGEAAPFHDRAYKRNVLPGWDERWNRLSVSARHLFLEKIPSEPRAPAVPTASLPAESLAELLEAGLVELTTAARDRVKQHPDAVDIATRLRTLHRFRLLDPDRVHQVGTFAGFAFSHYHLGQELARVLLANRVNNLFRDTELVKVFVPNWRWPRWVAGFTAHPLAGPVLDILEQTPRVSSSGFAELLHQPADAVRSALEGLIVHLAVFEDLDPTTLELQVGLLPVVRVGLERARHPLPRPALVPVVPATSPTSEAGTLLPDLRTLLVELAGSPARLRQGGELYQKDQARLESALEPLPEWYTEQTPAQRIHTASWIGQGMALLRVRHEGNHAELTRVDSAGEWLTLDSAEQFDSVVRFLAEDPSGQWQECGSAFLGSHISVSIAQDQGDPSDSEEPARQAPARHLSLRDALDHTFQELPWDAFVPWDVFLERVSVGAHNLFLLGHPLEQMTVRYQGSFVQPNEEQMEKMARLVLTRFLHIRLLPFGCVQAALDANDRLLILRTPRLDSWFGRQPPPRKQPTQASIGRVIVQPDFTIVIIGPNPTPTAELSPFCERVQGTVASGSVTFRITQESVVKGVVAGLAPGEILARLERHATTALPANVVQEVKGWCDRIRSVTPEPATLIRCPDGTSADRIQSILGRRVERLNETTLACPVARLERADRQKLLAQGILIQEPAGTTTRGNKRSRKKR